MGGMRFRKLRTAWSVGWALATVLLIVLWVRSYWRHDCVDALGNNLIATNIGSNCGELYYSQIDWNFDVGAAHSAGHGWRYQSLPPFAQETNHWLSLVNTSAIFRIGMPHWFLFVLNFALAATPWLRWRFTLRTLLVATTPVASGPGIIVWMSQMG